MIEEKNDVPTVKKEVKEGDDWATENDAEIGKTVEFRSTIKGQPGAANYVYHDTMTAGLTLNADSIKLLDGDGAEIDPSLYVIKVGPISDGTVHNCTFDVEFTKELCDSITAKDTVFVVSYTATLNADAINFDESTNTSYLSYGDNGESSTVPSTTITNTWKVPVFKHDPSQIGLAGAKFEFADNGGNAVSFVKVDDETYRVAIIGVDTSDTTHEIISPASGKFTIAGLDSGKYTLTETEAPEGYNKLAGPLNIEIQSDGTVKVTDANGKDIDVDTALGLKVENKTGSILPSTGGMGTTILYVVGGVLVIGAIIFLVRRRSSAAK